MEKKPGMVKNMIGAYGNTDIALHGGAMLRECVRYEKLARMTLYDETLWLFFDQVKKLCTKYICIYMNTRRQQTTAMRCGGNTSRYFNMSLIFIVVLPVGL